LNRELSPSFVPLNVGLTPQPWDKVNFPKLVEKVKTWDKVNFLWRKK